LAILTEMQKRIVLLVIIILTGCKKPYLPPVISAPGSYLVVEGVINSGTDSTVIKLSQTVNLSNEVTTNPVQKATVTVESDQNNSYALNETANGKYVLGGLNLSSAQKYRLRIKTADNKMYLSDFVAVLNSPPIDTVGFAPQSNTLNIYSGTHDVTGSVKYFRWDYQETWIIHSKYFSYFKSNGDTVLGRDLVNDNVYQCWQSDASSTIILGSTAKLAQSVIVNNPLTAIASTSEKIGSKYSIIVRQYALTGDAFTFWQNLKKNTEQLGSIFDAQPTEISGNIHSITNPSEVVIGYLSVGSVSSKRIFIVNTQLPAWVPAPAFPNCSLDTALYAYVPPGVKSAPYNQVNAFINYKKGAPQPALIPVDALGRPGSPPLGYTAAQPQCVDCTLRGTNKQPAFWQ
jgi:Domain of unknown function (DUF4249)